MAHHVSAMPLRRAELARLTGCNLETVRYYETVGLLPAPPRTAAGHRVYDGRHVARLGFIMRARQLGFSIDDMKSLLALVDRQAVTCAEVQSTALSHLESIRRKIADLMRLERSLEETLRGCSGEEVPGCPLIDVLLQEAGIPAGGDSAGP